MMKATDIKPSEAEKLSEQFYTFEQKLDGFRCLYQNGKLLSERGITQNHKFEHIVKAIGEIDGGIVLDGEMALENGTIHEINQKENWDKAKYYVFDLLELNGEDYTTKPLEERQKVLKEWVVLIANPSIVFVPKFQTFKEGWDYVEREGREGLIAKLKGSKYIKTEQLLKEARTKAWLKIKHKKEKVFVMSKWEEHQDDSGITFTDGFHRFSCRGENCDIAKILLREFGKVKVEIQYLYLTKDGHLFQPIVKRVMKDE